MSRDRAVFLLRKAHSLTGIIPVGAFLLAHLYINSGALLGECAFTDGVRQINGLPYLHYIELFGIIVPIAFHVVIGLSMAILDARYNQTSYNYSRNWWFFIQRITGIVLVLFLGWHLWDLVVAKFMGQINLDQFYGHLTNGMSTNIYVLAIYVVGTLAVSFHLANGVWGFCASWGILQSRKAQKMGGTILIFVGIVLAFAWLNIVWHFATGGSSIIPIQEPPVPCGAEQLQIIDG